MNPITYGNTFAMLFLIMGAVWGMFLLQLGVPDESAANVAVAAVFAALIMILVGAGCEVYRDYIKDDTEDKE